MNVADEIKLQEEKLRRCADRIQFLKTHRAKLEQLTGGAFCNDRVDFDNLNHKEIVTVIRTLGGKWQKTPAISGVPDKLDYVAIIDGVEVRCYQGEPPPSCRVVEVEETIPQQIIPARVVKVRKLVCQPAFAAVIATAAERGIADQPV